MPIKPVKSAAALLAAGVILLGAVEIGGELTARAAVRRFLASHREVVTASVAIEPFARAVTLRGVSARAGGTRITIGALRLPLPAAFEPFGAAAEAAAPASGDGVAGSVSAENVVVVVSGTMTFRIDRIDMTGTHLSNADLAALVDAKTGESLASRLKRLTASAIVIPEILGDDPTPGSERHLVLRKILLAGVTSGKAAAGSASSFAFALKDAQNAVDGTTGGIEATAVDLTQIAHVLGTRRTSAAEPLLPLYDSLAVNTVAIANVTRKSNLTLGSIRETAAKGRALRTDLAAAGGAATGPAPDPATAALVDDLAHSFAFGSFELTDIASRNEGPDGVTTFGMTRIGVQDFADRKIGGLGVSGFHLEGPNATFKIGTVDLGPTPLPAANQAASGMTPPSKADLAQIDIDMTTHDAGKAPSVLKLKVDHLGFTSDGGAAGAIPAAASLTVDNAAFDLPATGTASSLYDMGYRHVNLSGVLASRYQAKVRDLTVDKLSVNGTDMGSIVTKLHLAEVGEGVVSPDKEVQEAATFAMLLKGVDIDVVNAGLVQKAIEQKAKQDGMTVQQERDFGADFFRNKMPAIVNDNAKAKLVGNAVAAFLVDPKTLHVAIHSQSGLGVATMALLNTPELILDTLDVQASANQ